jgi:hypothetical protein
MLAPASTAAETRQAAHELGLNDVDVSIAIVDDNDDE